MIKNTVQTVILLCFIITTANCFSQQRTFYVSPSGNNSHIGTKHHPFLTVSHALSVAETIKGSEPVTISLFPGKYYLTETLRIHAIPFPLSIASADITKPVILSGAQKQSLKWTSVKEGVYYTHYTGKPADELYVNGTLYHMARYPDYDSTKRVFNGTATDAISTQRVKGWENPAGGYVHALHSGEWGGMHYKIMGKKEGNALDLLGGWQNNRPSGMNSEHRYVENIFEELTTPGEWYYNEKRINDSLVEADIYCIPLKGVNLNKALVELTTLNELCIIEGARLDPVSNITLNGISFTQTNRTFMQTREPLLRSDWAIFRGAAVRLDFAQSCNILNCTFENLGGNAIFVSNYNWNHTLSGNLIRNIGASGVCFVGNQEAVRSPLFRYEEALNYEQLDRIPGPATDNYPSECIVSDNLIHHIGRVEKQSAGVQLSMTSGITISHNTIYNTPRAGINVSEGTWGGHIIEFNEVFNTVLETGDHGAFNSWGRDRYWNPDREYMNKQAADHPEIILLDAQNTTVIRNNIFRCDHGWDIDLDDGSSNYHIYNNICLNGGLKLREGFYRTVENNMLINNTFHPHVWFKNSGDVFKHNIVTLPYAPIGIENAPATIDSNFFLTQKGLLEAQAMSTDKNSQTGNPIFQDADKGNYYVKPSSEAFNIGFSNFNTAIGVQSARLQKLAQHAPVPILMLSKADSDKNKSYEWLGATVKNIEGMGERSAAGLPDENGVLILDAGMSFAAEAGIKKGDVIRSVQGIAVSEYTDLISEVKKYEWTGKVLLTVFHNQQEKEITVLLK